MLTLQVSWASVPMTTQGFTQNQKQKHNLYYSSDTTVESKRSGSHIPALLSPFSTPTQTAILKLFSKNTMNVTFMCPLWPDNDFGWLCLRIIGSINTEPGALDMINRYELERASGAQTLLKDRHWDYNGVDMDYKMQEPRGARWNMCLCAFLKDKIILDVR